jgi:hypothetical protein
MMKLAVLARWCAWSGCQASQAAWRNVLVAGCCKMQPVVMCGAAVVWALDKGMAAAGMAVCMMMGSAHVGSATDCHMLLLG